MIAQIGKSLKNDFQISRVKKADRRSKRNMSHASKSNDDSSQEIMSLDSYRRRLIEDSILLEKGTEVIVLSPMECVSRSLWKDNGTEDVKVSNISFGSNKRVLTKAAITFSPHASRLSNSVTRDDFTSDLEMEISAPICIFMI